MLLNKMIQFQKKNTVMLEIFLVKKMSQNSSGDKFTFDWRKWFACKLYKSIEIDT